MSLSIWHMNVLPDADDVKLNAAVVWFVGFAGVAVIVATDDGSCLNLRAGPGLGAQVVTCLPNGTRAMVTGGSFDADGHTWWQLDGRGFAVADYLRLTGN